MTTKQCARCKEVKPVSEFRASVKTPDGYTSRCIKCQGRRKKVTSLDGLAICGVCGDTIEHEDGWTSTLYCRACGDKASRWKLNVWALCVRDPGCGAFRGGHFQVREVREGCVDGAWDPGTEFEIYYHGVYKYRVQVVGMMGHPQALMGVDDPSYRSRGDGRILLGGEEGVKTSGCRVWFQRGTVDKKEKSDIGLMLGTAKTKAEARLGRAPTTIVIAPKEAHLVPADCGLKVRKDEYQLAGTFGLE